MSQKNAKEPKQKLPSEVQKSMDALLEVVPSDGLLPTFVRHAAHAGIRTWPEYALGAFLPMLLCEMGHLGYRLVDEDAKELNRRGSSMNMWMVLVGRSGCGKSQGFKFAHDLFDEVYSQVAAGNPPSPFILVQGTEQGISDEIMRRWKLPEEPPSVLLHHDELMAILKGTGLITVQGLQRFHDGAGQESHLRTKDVEPLKPGYVTNAIFCMTPGQYEGFTQDMASGGFFSRLTIVATPHLIQPYRRQDERYLQACLTDFEQWYEGLIAHEYLEDASVVFPNKERRYMQERFIKPLQEKFLEEPNDARDGVISRLAWKTASLAALYATTTRFKAPYEIQREHLDKAIAYMEVTMDHSTEAAEQVGVSEFHRQLDALRRVLKANPDGIPRSKLHHARGLNGKVDKRTLDQLVETLEDREEVEAISTKAPGVRGRPAVLLRIRQAEVSA
jgi:hypothetical protein